jgi:hypothetical protein
MANEFIIKNGYRSQGNSEVTGSVIITGSLAVTGSLTAKNTGITVFDTNAATLYDTSTSRSIDWGVRVQYDTSQSAAISYGTRRLHDTNGTDVTINWADKKAYATSTRLSIDWGNRQLIKNDGSTVTLDWQNATFTGSMLGTASYAAQALSASWAPVSANGSQGNIQYNDGGSFGSDSLFNYNTGSRSLLHGNGVSALGTLSHAEGYATTTSGSYSHAEGALTTTSGSFSHAEGYGGVTRADYSHAEGLSTGTHGRYSHAEGELSYTGWRTGYHATLESGGAGLYYLDTIYGDQSAVFPNGSLIVLDDTQNANVIGCTSFIVFSSFWDGTYTYIQLVNTGANTTTATIASISSYNSNVGDQQVGGQSAHAEGVNSVAYLPKSHAEGYATSALGVFSHTEGYSTSTYGEGAHAEGSTTNAIGLYSHTEGYSTSTYGEGAHAEGGNSIAGYASYGPGGAITSGVFELNSLYGDLTALFSPASFVIIDDFQGEINGTPTVYKFEVASSTMSGTPATEITLVNTSINTASDKYAVGVYGNPNPTYADGSIGNFSHAEGNGTQTIGESSNTTGNSTIALGYYQSVVGQFNDPIPTPSALIIGDGVDDGTRHNLLVAASGSVVISGSLLVSGSITSTGGSITKNNVVANTSFSGIPLTASITFTTAFPNTNYSVVVTGEDARSWTIQSKTTSSFTINSNSTTALTGNTYWQAATYGEFNS